MPCYGHRLARLLTVLLAVALFALVGAAETALAATIQVTTSANENNTNPAACSLREAVTAANTNAAFGGCVAGEPDGAATDQITFAASTNGNVLTLGGNQIGITSNLDIVGNGVVETQISGNNASRIFLVSSGTVGISGMTIRDGAPVANGGGIANAGTLTLTNVILSDNTTGGGSDGGGIYNNAGALTIVNSTLSGNQGSSGGGVYNNGGALIITNSTFSVNPASTGGGIYMSSGTLDITDSTFSINTVSGLGGGIYLHSGMVTITNSTFNGNASAAGGAIANFTGILTVTNSTFSGNTAGISGGGISIFSGTLTAINTTLSGNSSPDGGGLYNSAGAVNLRATILDTGPTGGNCSGVITSLGSNLSDDVSCSFAQTGDVNNATLNLGTLADNNGPTFTHALQVGSAAIDAVQGSCTSDGTGGGTVIATDQRGVSRPRGAACDAGAFEFGVTPGALQFSAATFSVGEAGPTASVTITRTGGADFAVGATVSLTNGTATAPADYTATAQTVSFADGDAANKTVNIPIIEDALDEADETVNLALGSPTGGATIGAQAAATLTIVDNDPTPTLSIDDVTLAEGNAGATAFTFTVTLSAASGQTVTVQAQAADGTATVANSDYAAAGPATLTFVPGDTSETFTVQVTGDTTNEAAETFLVNLTNPTNATILDAQGVGTITNDDGPPSLSVSDPSAAEGDTGTRMLTFTVNLGPAAGQPVTVQYATADGTATGGASCSNGVDYQTASGTLTFQAGETAKSVNVTVCSDSVVEANETVLLNLSNPTVATILDGQAQGTITDDDSGGTVTFTAATASVKENGGSVTLTVQRAASGPTPSPASGGSQTGSRSRSGSIGAAALGAATVRYTTADGTATAGQDYTATTGTLTFGVGETSKTITVPIRDDSDTEPAETFTVTLSNPTGGASIGNLSTVTVTIVDTSVPAPALQGQDDTDPSRKGTKENQDTRLTEEEQRQRERTNRGNRDDIATEGNVIEVHAEANPPYIVLANRDGPVRVNLLCGDQCPIIKAGDYVEVDGEKQHEHLYDAEQVTIVK